MQSVKASSFLEDLPPFVRLFMARESMRKLTFLAGWPHNKDFVCIDDMAQAGLFYTGSSDKVACVYCDIILHEWKAGDVPIMDHWKYSNNCLFLIDPKMCNNVADVRGEEELEMVLACFPKRGIDEIDGKKGV